MSSRRAMASFRMLPDGDYSIADVPYQCQFASPSLVKGILENDEHDPRWRVFGYATEREAVYWAARQCGIACVKMVLDYYGAQISIADLTQRGVALGGYDTKNDRG